MEKACVFAQLKDRHDICLHDLFYNQVNAETLKELEAFEKMDDPIFDAKCQKKLEKPNDLQYDLRKKRVLMGDKYPGHTDCRKGYPSQSWSPE